MAIKVRVGQSGNTIISAYIVLMKHILAITAFNTERAADIHQHIRDNCKSSFLILYDEIRKEYIGTQTKLRKIRHS
jgi:hypothetical protein